MVAKKGKGKAEPANRGDREKEKGGRVDSKAKN